MRDLLQYRFPVEDRRGRRAETGLGGHAVGNLLLAAMTAIEGGDFEEGVRRINRILAVRGQVVPVSATPLTLHARCIDGSVVDGQSPDHAHAGHRARLAHPGRRPRRRTTPSTRSREADLIVIGPGSLYTSLLPSLLVPGVRDAVRSTAALRIYVCNVATQDGETAGMALAAHVDRAVRAHRAAICSTSSWPTTDSTPACPTTGRAEAAVRLDWPPPDAGAAPRPRRTSSTRTTPITTIPARLAAAVLRRLRGAVGTTRRGTVRAGMTASDRDLVVALRAELAAIDPARPCDRAAEAAGLDAATGIGSREPAVARLASLRRLRPSGRRRASRRRSTGPRRAEHCRIAWLRGRFLARGSLSLAGGRTHLEFVVPPDGGAGPRRPAGGHRAAGVVADPAWQGRRHLEERRAGRDVPAPDRRRGRAAGARGAPGLAGPARRAEPGAQRGVGQPPAVGGGRGPPARRDRRPRCGRSARGAAVRRPPRRRRAPRDAGGDPHRARRAARAPSLGASSAPSSASSAWPRPSRPRRTARPLWHDSRAMRDDRHRRQLEDAHHPGRCRRPGRDHRRAGRVPRRDPGHLPAVRVPRRRPRRAGRRRPDVAVGAQNVHHEAGRRVHRARSPPPMLAGLATWVIVGHSERRRDAGETDELDRSQARPSARCRPAPDPVRRRAARRARARRAEDTVVGDAARAAASPATTRPRLAAAGLVIAYEPVWAIGTGRNASGADAAAMADTIRAGLAAAGLADRRDGVPVLYGGSVTSANIGEFLAEPSIDGALVGGASPQARRDGRHRRPGRDHRRRPRARLSDAGTTTTHRPRRPRRVRHRPRPGRRRHRRGADADLARPPGALAAQPSSARRRTRSGCRPARWATARSAT